jgi:hypothetical protein
MSARRPAAVLVARSAAAIGLAGGARTAIDAATRRIVTKVAPRRALCSGGVRIETTRASPRARGRR